VNFSHQLFGVGVEPFVEPSGRPSGYVQGDPARCAPHLGQGFAVLVAQCARLGGCRGRGLGGWFVIGGLKDALEALVRGQVAECIDGGGLFCAGFGLRLLYKLCQR